ncbi:MAG: hypothetical protein KF787_11520 [Phycisphaeraceae bacterium]|nr:hypothetical protein [Phycisphaerae bacterium]MBX3393264.1 hypothetical protein [Phycisphaeraceae bacterium]HRJ50045.1 hypothetical protein [Phycisphaerales bacterium]
MKVANVLGMGAVIALTSFGALAATQGTSPVEPQYGQRNVLPVDGTWIILDEFMNVGDFFSGPWTYTSALPVQLDVTDLFVVTDVFEVYLNGGFVGATPVLPDYDALGVDPFGATFTSDPDVAWLSDLFSKGTFILPAGTHDVDFRNIQIPTGFQDGTIAFRASRIPSPGAAALFGFAGLMAARRRR